MIASSRCLSSSRRPLGSLCALLLLSLAAPAATLAGQSAATEPLAERISLDLVDAQANDVLQSFSSLLEVPVEILDRELENRAVSIRLKEVKVGTALTAVCESIGARWERQGKRFVVRVDPESPPVLAAPPAHAAASTDARLEEPLSLKLKEAAAHDVLKSFAKILSAELEMDERLSNIPITIELIEIPARQALDEICSAIRCWWDLTAGEAPTLVIKPLD